MNMVLFLNYIAHFTVLLKLTIKHIGTEEKYRDSKKKKLPNGEIVELTRLNKFLQVARAI